MTEWLPSVTWDDAAYKESEDQSKQKVGKTVAKKRASRVRTIEKLAEDVISFTKSVAVVIRADQGHWARQDDDSCPSSAHSDAAVQEDMYEATPNLKRLTAQAGNEPDKKQKRIPRTKDVEEQDTARATLCRRQDSTLGKMKSRLQGGRFRMLNETLYTAEGQEAFSLMQDSPELFQAYHDGFRVQSQIWKVNPVDLAIKWLKQKPKGRSVADFGCGDAKIAQALGNRHTVHSFDLFAHNKWVTACNMANVPCETGSCDAAVFSLALMGTDYHRFLQEAARVLTLQGWMWIAEVRSRFMVPKAGSEDFTPFLRCLYTLGFDVVQTDTKNQMFVVWICQKMREEVQTQAIRWPQLKPCIYKRR